MAGVSADETIRRTSPQSWAIQHGIDSLWNGLQKAGAVSAQATGSYLANSAKISNEILNFAVSHPVESVAIATIVVGAAAINTLSAGSGTVPVTAASAALISSILAGTVLEEEINEVPKNES